jgi:putative oxidoreductase
LAPDYRVAEHMSWTEELMHPVDIAALLLRAVLGATMLAHGFNHAFGGGKIAGTTRWFASIGMRPAWVHAYVATVTEIGSGVLLLLGLLTPLAAAGVLGTMLVALVTAHLRNGFFIFRPGQGYEYVVMICVVAAALAGTGAGWLSLDHVVGYPISGWVSYAVAVGAGGIGAALTLLTSWRPDPPVTEPASEVAAAGRSAGPTATA